MSEPGGDLTNRLAAARLAAAFVVIALLLAASATATIAAEITGTVQVTDGDTLDLGPVIIRLHGIDAPEAGQSCAMPGGGTWPCGRRATERLAELVEGQEVRCTARETDRYGRIVATCATAEVADVSAVLAAEGLAWAFRRYSEDYVSEEAVARAKELGVWQAVTQTPWDYRADRWNRAAAASPRKGCPIKGNVASDDERIYHTPWSPWYARTRVDKAKGERWFCDEAEAQASGWRAARWR